MPLTHLRHRRTLPDWLTALPIGLLVAAVVLAILFLMGIGHAQGAPNIQLTWEYTQGQSVADGFIVEKCSGSATCTNFASITPTPLTITTLTYTDTAIQAGTTYRWRILAKGPTGVSAPSNAVSFSVPLPPPVVVAPVNLRAVFTP